MGTRMATFNEQIEEPSVSQAVDNPNKMPKGIAYIVGNEAAERFSFYGMKTILVVFMTQYLLGRNGQLDTMTATEAKGWFHMFVSAAYFFPILGALIADIFWGKYKTIMTLSIVYCLGHLALALDETRLGLTVGLTLIAIGAGGIKPVVSAHVGDQFTPEKKHLIEKVFNWFYFSINFGSFFSTLLTPILLRDYGPSVAFGIPGGLMLIATIIFQMGHKVYTTVPPAGWAAYKRDLVSPKGKKAVLQLSFLYLFVSMFWALYDQYGSSWVLQAEQMERLVDLRFGPFQFEWLKFELLSSQLQAINPILVLLFIPLMSGVVYPFINKFFKLTPKRKIAIGMLVCALSFVIVSMAQERIDAGVPTSMMWQLWAYVVITVAEVMVSIPCLEFSYTQAPNSMKSFIMGLYLLCISLGNFFAGMVNFFIQREDGTFMLEGANYFWFFTIAMTVVGAAFTFASRYYKEEEYIQG